MSDPKTAIQATLEQYRNNLVASDAAGCAGLYATDGVTMAQNFESQVGISAIKEWYTLCFQTLSLDVEFKIHEIVVVSEEYAFARTSSAGTQKQVASGRTSQESNQELFVMQKVAGDWKIARYCFCTTKSLLWKLTSQNYYHWFTDHDFSGDESQNPKVKRAKKASEAIRSSLRSQFSKTTDSPIHVAPLKAGIGYGGTRKPPYLPTIASNMSGTNASLSKLNPEKEDWLMTRELITLTPILPSYSRSSHFDDGPPKVFKLVIQTSPILGIAATLLRNGSFNDIVSRYMLYKAALGFLKQIISHCVTVELVAGKRFACPPQAGILALSFPEHRSVLLEKQASATIESIRIRQRARQRHDEDLLTEKWGGGKGTETKEAIDEHAALKQELEQWHWQNCVDGVDDEVFRTSFHFHREAHAPCEPRKGCMKHLMTEISALQSSLPEGIFVRHGSSRLDLMTVLIVGPKGTPYEGGLFEFDIYCPLEYPRVPPRV